MMKLVFCNLLLFLVIFSNLYAQDTLKNQINWNDYLNQEWENYLKNLDSNWIEFNRQQEEEWRRYVKNVKQKWNEFEDSWHKKWVKYSENLNSKSIVNFEEGIVKIEAITEKNQENPETKVKEILLDKVKSLINTQIPTIKEPLFADQLPIKVVPKDTEKHKEKVFEPEDVDKFVKEKVAPEIKITTETFRSKDGIERIKAEVKFELNENHLPIRAKKYLPLVYKYSEKHSVDPALVMAIIENESAFNPLVTSERNGKPIATGLMQLVPWSGGKEAYNALGYNGEPTREFLKNPENNIRLGTKYLSILNDIYDKVNNEDKKRLLMISAYNTGPSNVNKTLCNCHKSYLAIEKVNDMDSTKLYNYMRQNLPFNETRKYLKSVERSYNKYKSPEDL